MDPTGLQSSFMSTAPTSMAVSLNVHSDLIVDLVDSVAHGVFWIRLRHFMKIFDSSWLQILLASELVVEEEIFIGLYLDMFIDCKGYYKGLIEKRKCTKHRRSNFTAK